MEETYKAKKKKLAKVVYEILKDNGRLTPEDLNRKIADLGYSTTLTMNFKTIDDAIEFLESFENLKELHIDYENFCTIESKILFTIRPKYVVPQTIKETLNNRWLPKRPIR